MPWRFLEVMAVPSAVLTAVAMRAVTLRVLDARANRDGGASTGRSSDLATMVAAAALVVVVVLTGVLFGSISRMTPALEPFRSGELSATTLAQTFHTRESFFLPRDAVAPTTLPQQPLVLPLTPGCRVTLEAWDQAARSFRVESDGPCEVALRSYYFPGWKAESSTERGTVPVGVRSDPESGGLLVSAPEGDSNVRVWFASGWPTVLGGVLSFVALMACVGLRRLPIAGRDLSTPVP